jgi:hypothetical protein
LEIRGEARFRDDLEAPLPFLDTRRDSEGVAAADLSVSELKSML